MAYPPTSAFPRAACLFFASALPITSALAVEQAPNPGSEQARPDAEAVASIVRCVTQGQEAVLLREGGSIPVVNTFREVLGLEPLLLGTYAPGEKAHSPNERYFVDDFFAAIRTGIHLFGSGA